MSHKAVVTFSKRPTSNTVRAAKRTSVETALDASASAYVKYSRMCVQ